MTLLRQIEQAGKTGSCTPALGCGGGGYVMAALLGTCSCADRTRECDALLKNVMHGLYTLPWCSSLAFCTKLAVACTLPIWSLQ